ncbi:hypothetical protein FJTKL_09427 [Diaporthe vaccinii]|uniref:FAD-binding PCMH-type domain-containing protein n=1 Tax=Diaporthe vaccinii TaxID=105482 RepID=A0ABR4FCN1_9PEZI
MVAGGRERDVAVAGFLLGGGTSLYTCRGGFGCDQVVNFEVVLADGRIIQANRDEHVDLFKALKGGGNNFGIVTRFDMQAFPASRNGIWDAVITYPAEAEDEILTAHFDFTKGLNHESDAHVLPFWFSSTKSQRPVITAILTHLDGLEDSKCLASFTAIPGTQIVKAGVTTVAKKMETLATPPGEYTTCNLVLKLDMRILSKITETHASIISRFAERLPDKEIAVYFVVHPFPARFGRNSAACGGNVMGVENIEEDCILLQASLATDNLPRSAYFPIFKEGLDELEAFAQSIDKSVKFRYLNYSDISDDPLATYGDDNVKQMREVANKYDPTGVFQTRVPGGFKISKIKVEKQ